MAKTYKNMAKMLYDEFGNDLIEAGKEFGHEAIANAIKKSKDRQQSSHEKAEENICGDMGTEDVQEQDDFEVVESEEEISETNYYDADTFEKETLTQLGNQAAATICNPTDVADAIHDLIMMAGEVRKFEEAQITVRTDIAAQRDVALANIEAQKVALLVYLDKSFDERKENFRALFTVVDEALEKDNMQALAMGLDGIIKLADSSPFKDLATVEATAAALTDENHVWDF